MLEDGEVIEEGQRETVLASLAGTMRRRGMTERAILAALLAMNEDCCEPRFTEDTVQKIAHSIARYQPADPVLKRLADGPGGRTGHSEVCFTIDVEV